MPIDRIAEIYGFKKISNLAKYRELVLRQRRPPKYKPASTIPYLCRYLEKEGFENETIRDKVRKDLIFEGFWSRATVDRHIPKKYLNAERITRGRKAYAKVIERKKHNINT